MKPIVASAEILRHKWNVVARARACVCVYFFQTWELTEVRPESKKNLTFPVAAQFQEDVDCLFLFMEI